MTDSSISLQWEAVVQRFSTNNREPISIEGILLLIGIQESNIFLEKYSKEEKMDCIHIGMCSILKDEGYYDFSHYDEQKWPHYNNVKPLPEMNTDEENLFIKEKIITYCKKNQLIE